MRASLWAFDFAPPLSVTAHPGEPLCVSDFSFWQACTLSRTQSTLMHGTARNLTQSALPVTNAKRARHEQAKKYFPRHPFWGENPICSPVICKMFRKTQMNSCLVRSKVYEVGENVRTWTGLIKERILFCLSHCFCF